MTNLRDLLNGFLGILYRRVRVIYTLVDESLCIFYMHIIHGAYRDGRTQKRYKYKYTQWLIVKSISPTEIDCQACVYGVCVFLCVGVCVCVVCVCVCVFVFLCVYICMCVCVGGLSRQHNINALGVRQELAILYTHTHVFVNTHKHTHTHTHTPSHLLFFIIYFNSSTYQW